jgi:cytosine/uracil/thiamine/allantoin permease
MGSRAKPEKAFALCGGGNRQLQNCQKSCSRDRLHNATTRYTRNLTAPALLALTPWQRGESTIGALLRAFASASGETSMAAGLPEYVTASKPVPQDARVGWFANIAPTYAGVMVWFLFWQNVPGYGGTPGGLLAAGLMPALAGVVVAALIIHFLFYLVPGLLGMQTGRPLYVVGTSTYGVLGGFIMPGLFMGILQFFWLGFNAFFVADVLCQTFGIGLKENGETLIPGPIHGGIAVLWAVAGAFVGLKGIQYVAKVATFFPLIPIAVLIILTVATIGGVGNFTPDMLTQTGETAAPEAAAAPVDQTTGGAGDDALPVEEGDPPEAAGDPAEAPASGDAGEATAAGETEAPPAAPATAGEEEGATAAGDAGPEDGEAAAPAGDPLNAFGVFLAMIACIVGFFATAGAAGVDIAMNSKDSKNVQIGGLVGITLATIFSCGLACVVVAGFYGGAETVPANLAGKLDPVALMNGGILSTGVATALIILLAISSFPAACFSSFIAANSFRTTLPQVNPYISVGVGAAIACVLAVSGAAGNAAGIFQLIGASFGPVCGAMLADYLLAGGKWPGPRAGFNLAGWISWFVGFVVGAPNLFAMIPGLGFLKDSVPCTPIAAFVVGFVLYFLLAKVGLQGQTLEMPAEE